MLRRVTALHEDESGLTTLETVAVLTIAAIVLGVCKYYWVNHFKPWFRQSVTNVVEWQGSGVE